MTKWEYGYLSWSAEDDKEWVFTRFTGAALPNIQNYDVFDIALFELGQSGWEMVSWNAGPDSFYETQISFKRRIDDK